MNDEVMDKQWQKRTNICFDCDNACGGCSWSEVDENGNIRFDPVPGWTAEKIITRTGTCGNKPVMIETYHITACPLFKPSRKR